MLYTKNQSEHNINLKDVRWVKKQEIYLISKMLNESDAWDSSYSTYLLCIFENLEVEVFTPPEVG